MCKKFIIRRIGWVYMCVHTIHHRLNGNKYAEVPAQRFNHVPIRTLKAPANYC